MYLRPRPYRLLPHTADAALQACGRDLPELFAHAAQGLFATMTNLARIRPLQSRAVVARAPDTEALLVAWLNEFVYLFDAHHPLFRRVQVTDLRAGEIHGTAWGEPLNRSRHDIRCYIKSTTYHGLSIRRTSRGYTARVIFDI